MTIYDPSGKEIINAPVTKEAIIKFVLMGDYYIELPFNLLTPLKFPQGSYILYKNRKFEIMSEVYPTFDSNTGGYKYTLQFQAQQNHMKRFVCFWLGGTNPEAVFHNTTDLASFGRLIVANMNKALGGENWKMGSVSVDYPETTKLVSFNGDKCWDALTTIAETFETEWWTEDNAGTVTLHFGKLDFGSPEKFERGDAVKSMPAKKGDDSAYGTRFYVFGSTRNLTKDYGQAEQGGITNHVSEIRLRLPNGQQFIDAKPNLSKDQIVEQVVFFDDIYPKNTETITGIETIPRKIGGSEDENATFDAYVMKCANTPFLPSDVIPGETMGAVFTSGSLNGREFELALIKDDAGHTVIAPETWKPEDGFNKKFEIIAQQEDAGGDKPLLIPNASLHPEPGDTFVLTGVKLPQQRIAEAEQDLLEAGKSYASKHSSDTDVYDCETNPVYCTRNDKNYEAGQSVLLVGPQFGDNGRLSRIQGYEKRLYNEYIATYTVGDNTPYSRLRSIEADAKASLYSQRFGVDGGNRIHLITRYDNSTPTDTNAYSARRAIWEFANKQSDDTFNGRITFKKDANFGEFASGPTGIGGRIDPMGRAELDSLSLRRFLETPELRYNRTEVTIGDKWSSFCVGILSEVDERAGIITLKLEEGEIGSPRVGDICMGIFHSHISEENATEDYDDGKGNRRFAGFATCYFHITEIIDPIKFSQFKYELRPISDNYPRQTPPKTAMTFVGYGSFTDVERRTSRYDTRTYQRYLKEVSDWEFTSANIAAQFGDLSNLSIFGMNMSGYSAYLDDIYMRGVLQSIDGTFKIDSQSKTMLLASSQDGQGLAFSPQKGLVLGKVYDPGTGKFSEEFDLGQIKDTAVAAKKDADDLEYLKKALKDDSTEIAGGLILSKLIGVKGENGNITSGLSTGALGDQGIPLIFAGASSLQTARQSAIWFLEKNGVQKSYNPDHSEVVVISNGGVEFSQVDPEGIETEKTSISPTTYEISIGNSAFGDTNLIGEAAGNLSISLPATDNEVQGIGNVDMSVGGTISRAWDIVTTIGTSFIVGEGARIDIPPMTFIVDLELEYQAWERDPYGDRDYLIQKFQYPEPIQNIRLDVIGTNGTKITILDIQNHIGNKITTLPAVVTDLPAGVYQIYYIADGDMVYNYDPDAESKGNLSGTAKTSTATLSAAWAGGRNRSKIFGNGLLFSKVSNQYCGLIGDTSNTVFEQRSGNKGFRCDNRGTWKWNSVSGGWVPFDGALYRGIVSQDGVIEKQWSYNGRKLTASRISTGEYTFYFPIGNEIAADNYTIISTGGMNSSNDSVNTSYRNKTNLGFTIITYVSRVSNGPFTFEVISTEDWS